MERIALFDLDKYLNRMNNALVRIAYKRAHEVFQEELERYGPIEKGDLSYQVPFFRTEIFFGSAVVETLADADSDIARIDGKDCDVWVEIGLSCTIFRIRNGCIEPNPDMLWASLLFVYDPDLEDAGLEISYRNGEFFPVPRSIRNGGVDPFSVRHLKACRKDIAAAFEYALDYTKGNTILVYRELE